MSSIFTKEELTWIVTHYLNFGGPVNVRREFLRHFNVPLLRSKKLFPQDFKRAFSRFNSTGSLQLYCQRKPKPLTATGDANVAEVKQHFELNPHSSVRICSNHIGISPTSTWRILRKNLKLYPYRPSKVQILTEEHKTQRKAFCEWLLEKISLSENFPQEICFSDEKWFVLHQSPNSQNDRTWSIENPHDYSECKEQGQPKVMCWAGFCHGVFLPLVWFTDDNDNPVSVNKERYLKMIQKKIIPSLKRKSYFNNIWWMQDGAPCHTAKIVMEFLTEKFGGKIISRNSPIPWPAKSPDLNPLDYWFWGYAQARVQHEKPTSIAEVQEIVTKVARNCRKEIVERAAMNIAKRASKCFDKNGSHFESEM